MTLEAFAAFVGVDWTISGGHLRMLIATRYSSYLAVFSQRKRGLSYSDLKWV